jgi:hypothetical protein
MRNLFLVSITLALSSCGILIWRNIECRPYTLNFEEYWVQGEEGLDGVTLMNPTHQEKTFSLKDKWISHTEHYFSDTGCKCRDGSAQLLSTATDSIWMVTEANYIENAKANYLERVVVIINGQKSIFSNFDLITNSTQLYSDSILVRTYESDTISKGVYAITFAKGIGPIELKLKNGEHWESSETKPKEISPISSYRFKVINCN